MRRGAWWTQATLTVVVAANLPGCASRTSIPEKPETFAYACDEALNRSISAVKCDVYIPLGAMEAAPLPKCEDMKLQGFRPTTHADMTILNFRTYYSSNRLNAAFNQPFDYKVSVADWRSQKMKDVYLRIPRGYLTDFSSIPRGLPQAFFRTFTKHIYPSFAHDFLYDVAPPDANQNDFSDYDRRFADDVLKAGLNANESGILTRVTMRAAVGIFGSGGFGSRDSLKFLDPEVPDTVSHDNRSQVLTPQVLIPTRSYSEQGYKDLRERYVRICEQAATQVGWFVDIGAHG